MARLMATLLLPSSGTEEVIKMVLQLLVAERNSRLVRRDL